MSKHKNHILALDQGTTSTRAILFDAGGRPVRSHALPLRQIYPDNGWVEHDPREIWQAALACARAVLKGMDAGDVAAVGITNQRETSLIWDRKTGAPLYNAIVWQDRRGAARCAALKKRGLESGITRKTGLLLDPYFSATKLEWLLKNAKGLKGRDVAFGTIDSWLIWNLTRGRVHATDVTNASRTMLWNLKTRDWDRDLLKLFGVPKTILPDVRESRGDFGATDPMLLGAAIPILGVAGDQQAASFGQACFAPGDVKSTYGTGCFALVNTGKTVPRSRNRLLATALAQKHYAIEGSIFIAGAVVQWLRDELAILATAPESEALAKRAKPADGLYFVPAFTGLGAPYWDPQARGAIVDRPVVTETTALGAAYLAGLGAGLFRNERDIAKRWALDRRFKPKMNKAQRDILYRGWLAAVARVQ